MIDLGLSADELELYLAALMSSHRVRIRVRILDHDENPVGSLTAPTSRVQTGAVQVDATQPISRSLSLTVLDPKGRLIFDPNSPAQGALFMGYMVQAFRDVYVAAVDEWVSCPVFMGPLTAYGHTGPVVSLEAQGKEALLLEPYVVTEGYSLKKNDRVHDAIREVIGRAGETRYSIPDFPGVKVHPHDMHVRPGDQPLDIVTGEAGGQRGLLDLTGADAHDARYNARGRFEIRGLHKSPVFTFEADTGLLSWPDVAYDLKLFRNWVIVHGGKSKGAKRNAIGRASLPPGDPRSPESLARGAWPATQPGPGQRLAGPKVPGRIPLIVRAPNLVKDIDCAARAEKLLAHHSTLGVSASFDALAVPTLEENDYVAAQTKGEGFVAFPLKQFTIPLTAGDSMSVGANKRTRKRNVVPRRVRGAPGNMRPGSQGGLGPGPASGSSGGGSKPDHHRHHG